MGKTLVCRETHRVLQFDVNYSSLHKFRSLVTASEFTEKLENVPGLNNAQVIAGNGNLFFDFSFETEKAVAKGADKLEAVFEGFPRAPSEGGNEQPAGTQLFTWGVAPIKGTYAAVLDVPSNVDDKVSGMCMCIGKLCRSVENEEKFLKLEKQKQELRRQINATTEQLRVEKAWNDAVAQSANLNVVTKANRAVGQAAADVEGMDRRGKHFWGCWKGLEQQKMKNYLEQLKRDLKTAQEEAEKTRDLADEAQKECQKVEKEMLKMESLPRKTESVATNSTFLQEVQNFRTKTPAEQRVMRSNIEDLLHQLERTRSDLENERERKEHKIREARQHEKLAEALPCTNQSSYSCSCL